MKNNIASLLFFFTTLAFAQDRTLGLEMRVRQGGAPNTIQQFMLYVYDSSKEIGVSATVRPGEASHNSRIMYVDVSGPIKKIDDFKERLKSHPGVLKFQAKSNELAIDPNKNFTEQVTRKYRVTGVKKGLGSLLDAIRSAAGKSQVIFMDAIPNVGGEKRFVTIQVKGLNAHLDDFYSSLKGTRGVDEVYPIPEEVKKK